MYYSTILKKSVYEVELQAFPAFLFKNFEFMPYIKHIISTVY